MVKFCTLKKNIFRIADVFLNLIKKLEYGSFLQSFSTKILVMSTGFLTTLFLVKYFGAEALAQFGLFLSVLVVSTQFTLMGAQFVLLKKVPDAASQGAISKIVVSVLIILTFGTFFYGFSVHILNAFGQLHFLKESFGADFLLLLPLMVFFNSLRILLNEFFRSRGSIGNYNFFNLAFPVTLLLVLVGLCLLGVQEIQPVWVIFFLDGAFAFILILSLQSMHSFKFMQSLPNFSEFASTIKLSLLYFISSFSVFVGQIDIIIVAYYLSAEEIAAYVIVTRIGALVLFVIAAINVSFATEVSKKYKDKGIEECMKLGKSRTLFLVPIAVIVGGASLILAYPMLLLYGPVFLENYPVLLVFVIGYISISFFGPVGVVLNMTFGQREIVMITILEVISLVIMCLLFIPSLGLIGGALANVISQFIRNVVATVVLQYHTKSRISIF